MGDADYARPKFTSFNDTRLADIFKRPSAEPVTAYHLALAIGIPVLFCVSLGVQLFPFARCLFRDSRLSFFKMQSTSTTSSGQHTTRKSRTGLFQTFYIFLITASIALIGTIACLLALSSLPDLDASRKCLISLCLSSSGTNQSSWSI